MDELTEKANSIYDLPVPTKETKPRQRSININDIFLTRLMPPWSRPPSLPAYTWRTWVLNQPVATDCKEFLVSSLLSLDWKITPRNSNYKEELQATIKYYTDLINNGGKYDELGLDYAGLTEWIMGDLLDLPFGGAAEVGRKGDAPGGRVAWIRPLDGGTLYPTLNRDYPVVQYYMGYDAVVLPAHAVVRTYMSPQQFIWREGWGMAPPEKIYFVLDLLTKGDKYYANLLLDVPTAGILDLGDMEKSSAEEWVTAFKTFINDNQTSFKIPVLYEHNNKIEFIPLGKVPNDIMYDKITHKYASLMCAAYGISAQDIGLVTSTSSGETLAGTIRSQRQTKITGRAKVKSKMKGFWDRILPPSLEFVFIDYDTEDMINFGRARLASATAFQIFQQNGNLSPQEIRSQIIADGLVNVNIPDELPPDAKPMLPAATGAFGKPLPTEPEAVGSPKAPSQGGEGDIKKRSLASYSFDFRGLSELIQNVCIELVPDVYQALLETNQDELMIIRSLADEDLFGPDRLGRLSVVRSLMGRKSAVQFALPSLEKDLKALFGNQYTKELKSQIRNDLNDFLGQTIVYNLNEAMFTDDVYDDFDFMSLIEQVHSKVFKSLNGYLEIYLRSKLEPVREKINDSVSTKPDDETLKLLSALEQKIDHLGVASKTPIEIDFNPVFNPPDVTVNIPERRSDVTVEAPVINLSLPKTDINLPAPQVQVDVESPVVNLPKQDAPIVNVSIPTQEAPIVNVAPVVNPTPVEITNPITVNVPKVTREEQRVNRDAQGFIQSTETDVHYEDEEE